MNKENYKEKMKKRNKKVSLTILTTATVMAVPFIFGCGKEAPAVAPAPAEDVTEAPAAEPTEDVTEEPADTQAEDVTEDATEVGMANPWVEITEEEADTLCPRLFTAPEGANVQAWLKCDELGNPDEELGSVVQLSFELDGMDFTARAQYGAAEDADISGLYVDWTVGPDDVTLANWGEGHMSGKTYRSINEDGYVDLITWYDVEIGIKYSLSVAAKDLDGFDIQAIAEQMYCADNEPDVGE